MRQSENITFSVIIISFCWYDLLINKHLIHGCSKCGTCAERPSTFEKAALEQRLEQGTSKQDKENEPRPEWSALKSAQRPVAILNVNTLHVYAVASV